MDSETGFSKEVNRILIEEFVLLFSKTEDYENWFSQRERDLFPFPVRAKSLAARYLVKKTVSEKLDQYNKYNQIEILNNDLGKPEIILSEELSEITNKKGFKKIMCSLSHSRTHAIGMTVFCY